MSQIQNMTSRVAYSAILSVQPIQFSSKVTNNPRLIVLAVDNNGLTNVVLKLIYDTAIYDIVKIVL